METESKIQKIETERHRLIAELASSSSELARAIVDMDAARERVAKCYESIRLCRERVREFADQLSKLGE